MPNSTTRREDEPTTEVLHMWTPYRTVVDENYDFIPKGRFFRFCSKLLRGLALFVLPIYNRLLFRLKIEGLDHIRDFSGGAVTICNHVHVLDCSMVASCFPRRMVHFPTLKSNVDIPVIATLVRLLGGVPIPKTPRALRAFSNVVDKLLEDGGIVHVYPEGILSPYYAPIRSFRRGAFSYAAKASVPIIPMVITYRQPVGWLTCLFHRRPFLTLTVLPPVPPPATAGREEIDAFREECFQRMNHAFYKNNQTAPVTPVKESAPVSAAPTRG